MTDNLTIVYRVQDRTGRGPWRPGFSDKWIEHRDDHSNLLSLFEEFGDLPLRGRIYGMSIGCACLSIQQLRRWFTQTEYRTLNQYGYRAVKMRASRILASSDIQCVFERAKPLHKNVVPISLYPQEGEQ